MILNELYTTSKVIDKCHIEIYGVTSVWSIVLHESASASSWHHNVVCLTICITLCTIGPLSSSYALNCSICIANSKAVA